MDKFLEYLKMKRDSTMLAGFFIIFISLILPNSGMDYKIDFLISLIWVTGVGTVIFGWACRYYKNLKVLIILSLVGPLLYLYGADTFKKLLNTNGHIKLIEMIMCLAYLYGLLYFRNKN